MKTSTLKKLSFNELRNKDKAMRRTLYFVGTACILSIFGMLYFILSSAGIGMMNILLGAVSLGLTVYLYRLSDAETQVHEEIWMRIFRKA